MKKNLIISMLLAMFMLLAVSLVAQPGPYTYRPPEGIIRWADTTGVAHNYIPLSMNQLSQIPASDDGLMVSFHVNLALNENEKPLIALALGGEDPEDNLIEVVYSKRTVTVTRYTEIGAPLKRIHYPYHSFDPLFEDNGITTSQRWRIQVYFTSEFMYFVVSIMGTEVRNFMTAFYFGLDSTYRMPDSRAKMFAFLRRYQTANVKLGDQNRGYPPYVFDVTINSFKYDDFWRTVQREFSSPNPPGPVP